ncbi:MAG: hypothetical protein A2V81_00780 [Candidatus Abawacabacteria bacterium RBG_16_42_10]|uniref:Ribosomal RNA large subunit methyltransferase K/L-like methyltransferase domain-containing protein n=1 Tax=Candidatus Abawacabacteria bacterium RBG_16_42_10 TaxID=1817814 RepID=A0A1F4XI86_9BACT|nr:MAG: hypothetical protein A2V81_00780 [Candidatus Abawacabacteria bacterium RBG_16_42_10]
MYFFYFGRHPKLSLWELHNVLPETALLPHPLGVIVDEKDMKGVDIALLQKRLGGTREIVFFHKQTFADWEEALVEKKDWLARETGREITLIAPDVNDPGRELMLKKLKIQVHEETKLPIRYRLDKHYLVEEGGTVFWWLKKSDNEFWLGKALAQQTVKAYEERDYGKPSRSMQRGMLPPKLAQIIINGARFAKDENKNKDKMMLWDPFCGTGTVLIEAALSGIQSIGSDIDAVAIAETKKNISAILDNDHQKKIHNLWQQDITQLWDERSSEATVIVAEGYLGPLLTSKLQSMSDTRSFWQKVEPLYQKFFHRLKDSQVKKIVIATPLVITNEGISRLAKRTWDILLKNGWQKIFSDDYTRPDQFVGREISCIHKS